MAVTKCSLFFDSVPVQIQNCTPNLTLTASQAQPVTLTCSVTGKPQPRVAWYSLPDMVLLKSSITSHSALVITKSAVEIRVKRGLRQYLFETVNHPNGKKRTRVLTVYGKCRCKGTKIVTKSTSYSTSFQVKYI